LRDPKKPEPQSKRNLHPATDGRVLGQNRQLLQERSITSETFDGVSASRLTLSNERVEIKLFWTLGFLNSFGGTPPKKRLIN
jgi:hypothetical protein